MTTKADVYKAIREKCLDCCCDSWREVKRCHITGCALHPHRFGKDPAPARKGGTFKKLTAPDHAQNSEQDKTIGE